MHSGMTLNTLRSRGNSWFEEDQRGCAPQRSFGHFRVNNVIGHQRTAGAVK
jgi:hypothetical protein